MTPTTDWVYRSCVLWPLCTGGMSLRVARTVPIPSDSRLQSNPSPAACRALCQKQHPKVTFLIPLTKLSGSRQADDMSLLLESMQVIPIIVNKDTSHDQTLTLLRAIAAFSHIFILGHGTSVRGPYCPCGKSGIYLNEDCWLTLFLVTFPGPKF